jgi:hypothetical protein
VVSFIGHMIDHPSRKVPRFPAIIENQVRNAIVASINTLNAKIGFCSLACGSDLLFAESMAAAGGELNIWLPFAKEDFVEASVRFAGGDWVERFDRIVSRFPVNYITHEPYLGKDDLFSFQNRVIFGSAIIRGTMSHTEPTLVTVLSETDLKRQEGGTRDTLSLWPFPSRHININPDNYYSPSSIVISPEQGNVTKPVYPPLDRPVLYGIVADLPSLTPEEQEKAWSNIIEQLDLPILSPVTFEIDKTLLVTFRSMLGTMDLAKVVLREIKAHFLSDKLRLSLYAGPAELVTEPDGKQKRIAPEWRRKMEDLHALVPTGAVYAFARFSSALSLDIDHYSVDYAGVVTPSWFPEPIEIFRINVLEGSAKTA